jgi:glucokinase
MFLGIEIGGTKLQLGIGPGDGTLAGLWRGTVDVAAGPEGIRQQITAAVPELLTKTGLSIRDFQGVGIGFGGPVDDATRTVIKSHQIEGWDNFPLADWIGELVALPAALGNDADCAGLAEALFGAGKGLSPIFYITIGSGIGGGLIIDGEIYRGCGRGAAEIGHVRIGVYDPEAISIYDWGPLEKYASGWGIAQSVRQHLLWKEKGYLPVIDLLSRLGDPPPGGFTAKQVAQAASEGDGLAQQIINGATELLAEAICQVIVLLCPRRIVIGGGVSLMGEKLLFEPLRKLVAERVFKPFAGCYDIVPAALGEEVVVHGVLALARRRLSVERRGLSPPSGAPG